MRTKRASVVWGVVCLIFMLAVMFSGSVCALAAPKPIKIACTSHFPPPPAPPAKAAADIQAYVDFARKVKEATNGRVVIEYFWGSSLGKVNDFIRMVGNPGIADAGIICTVYNKWEIPLTAGTGLPFRGSNLEAQGRAMLDLLATWKPIQDEWDKVNCKVLWLTPCPYCATGTKDKQIKTLDDFKGEKIWGVGYYADALNRVGAKVVSFPGGEIYESLAKGVIDGAYFPYTGHYMFGFWELLNYELNTDNVGAHCNMMWSINKDVWNKISKGDQEAMKKIGAEMFEEFLANYKAENIRVNETFIKKGIKFSELSAADWAKWKALAGPATEKEWLEQMDKRGQGEEARELLKRHAALYAEYEAKAKYGFIFPK